MIILWTIASSFPLFTYQNSIGNDGRTFDKKDNGGDWTERSQLFFVKQFSYTAVAVVTDRIAKNPAGLEYLPCLFQMAFEQ